MRQSPYTQRPESSLLCLICPSARCIAPSAQRTVRSGSMVSPLVIAAVVISGAILLTIANLFRGDRAPGALCRAFSLSALCRFT